MNKLERTIAAVISSSLSIYAGAPIIYYFFEKSSLIPLETYFKTITNPSKEYVLSSLALGAGLSLLGTLSEHD